MTQIDYSNDFLAFFRDLFPVEGDYGPKPMITRSLEDFFQMAFPHGDPGFANIADFRTKKEGKSITAGAVGLYMAARRPYAEVCIAAATKIQSRDRVFKAIKYAIQHHDIWSGADVHRDEIHLDNGSIIQCVGDSWKAAAGGNWDAVIHDELWTATLESQRRRFSELVVPPTRKAGVRWMSSYAGYLDESTLLKEWWDRGIDGLQVSADFPMYINEDADLLAWIDTGEESWRMPWADSEYMEQQRRTERPNVFKRIWLNEWIHAESNFIDEDLWLLCVDPEHKPLTPTKDFTIHIGIDVALSPKGDDSACVGVYQRPTDGRPALAFHKVWKASDRADKLKLSESIEPWLLQKAKEFRMQCYYDPFQFERSAEALERFMPMYMVRQSHPVLGPKGRNLWTMIKDTDLILYPHLEIEEAVRHAVGREIPQGILIEKKSGHIDLIKALSFVADLAWDKRAIEGPRRFSDWGIYKKSVWGETRNPNSPWTSGQTGRSRWDYGQGISRGRKSPWSI